VPRDDPDVLETAECDPLEPPLRERFGESLDSLSMGFSVPRPADTPHVVGRGGRFDLQLQRK
jgi:hypothetical protein